MIRSRTFRRRGRSVGGGKLRAFDLSERILDFVIIYHHVSYVSFVVVVVLCVIVLSTFVMCTCCFSSCSVPSVLVGKLGRDSGMPISSDNAELEVSSIHDIANVLPELFAEE
jgi:hypothetical protein